MHYAHSHFVNFPPVKDVSCLYTLKALTVMNLFFFKNDALTPQLIQDPNITATLTSLFSLDALKLKFLVS